MKQKIKLQEIKNRKLYHRLVTFSTGDPLLWALMFDREKEGECNGRGHCSSFQ